MLQVVNEQYGYIDDLKERSNVGLFIYDNSAQKAISEDMEREFKADLKLFKPE